MEAAKKQAASAALESSGCVTNADSLKSFMEALKEQMEQIKEAHMEEVLAFAEAEGYPTPE